ncbi:MAG: GntR family transcriptional regulator [Xanthomonadales bacterium]|nr:GntR family transcriptional regulator [Xanthomonadales bacterium]
MAAHLADNADTALIQVEEPAISRDTVRDEWSRLIAAIKPEIAARMQLELSPSVTSGAPTKAPSRKAGERRSELIPVERPNYRAEVLRLLVGASLANDGMWSVKGLIQQIGASQTPIRQALQDLKRSGVLHEWDGGHVDLVPENLSAELLAKLQAMPQTLRFRFERGARIRTPAELLERALPLLGTNAKGVWEKMALSGAPVAQSETPALDLAGVPRVDLVAFVPRDAKAFDAHAMRKLSDGLEYEPNVLATAPVVVTLVRADEREIRANVIEGVRCAPSMDVFLALLDMNLRGQAAKYAKAVRA